MIEGRDRDSSPARAAPRLRALLVLSSVLLQSFGCAWVGVPTERPVEDAGTFPVFYPEPPNEPRIQYLATYSSEKDVTGGASLFQRFILGESEYSELGKPYGVAMHDGKLFVCDSGLNAVVIFDLRARGVSVMGNRSPGRLAKPINIAVDEDGTRFVADTRLGRVMVYDDQGRYQRAVGDPEQWSPSDVAIFGEKLYVTDVRNGQVAVIDKSSGEELRRIASKGAGEAELFFPTNLEVDAAGHLFVSDTGNFRVLEFDEKGELVRQFGSLGRGLGQFARPKGIAVDRSGQLYVVDSAFENVQVFNAEAELLLFFASSGNHPGGINLPAQVEIDYDNVGLFADRVAPGHEIEYLILVSSQFGLNKVNVYGYLKARGDTTN